jgi:hypothetical protein
MGFLDTTIERIHQIRNAETPATYIRQRMAERADQLSKKTRIQASIEVANEALYLLSSILYETLDRQLVNLDSRTFRLLIPVPWGDSGYQHWGLRSTEARILRAILTARSEGKQDALFDYSVRQWFLNANTYPDSKAALEYLRDNPIRAREWISFYNAWREQQRQRMKTNRT